jgi:AcrR family transcriptional regulator
MTRTRLTREESREQTRTHLLDAAQKLVSEKGLAASSVEDITREAGYTRGAFYSNYSSKDELFLDLLTRFHRQEMANFDQLYSSCDDLVTLREHTRILFRGISRDKDCCFCWAEAHLLAARDAQFRKAFNELTRQTLDKVAGYIRHFYQLAGFVSPVSAEEVAFGILSISDGVQLHQISNTEQGEMWAEKALERYIDSLMDAAFVKDRQAGSSS